MVQTDNIIPLIICGPTASGKSDIAIEAAHLLNGEIISADSMQIYKGLNIGTAKINMSETDIPHHMIDIIEPSENFSVAEYKEWAQKIIKEIITARGRIPIISGGTGLYINALIYDYDFINIQSEPKLKYHAIGLKVDRAELYSRINLRVEHMFKNGLTEEVRKVLTKINFDAQSMRAIGYKEFKDYFDGKITEAGLIKLIQQNTRNYAKRQITWFKKSPGIIWCTPDNAIPTIKNLYGIK